MYCKNCGNLLRGCVDECPFCGCVDFMDKPFVHEVKEEQKPEPKKKKAK